MIEYYELLIALIIFMLWTNHKYPNNYYLSGFWVICISWYGVYAISNILVNQTFGIICLFFNVMLNLFIIEKGLHKRNE